MPFVKITGLAGQVYVPEQVAESGKRHPCPDCFSCQMCSDERCHVCRSKKPAGQIVIQDAISNKNC